MAPCLAENANTVRLPVPKPLEEQNDMRSYETLMLLAVPPGFIRYMMYKMVWKIGKMMKF
jgi:hypothetical protein